jgi:membrane protein DedA with SNARE-associated domain
MLQRRPASVTLWVARGLVLAAVAAAVLFVLLYRGNFENWARLGYPAVFLICLVTNLAVLVPLPGFGITVVAGSVLNPWIVGQTIGDLNSYLAGSTSKVILDDLPHHDRVFRWMRQRGALTVFVLAALPNPFLSAAIVVAGATDMPLARFFAVTLAGKVIKSTAAALAGYYGVEFLRKVLGA